MPILGVLAMTVSLILLSIGVPHQIYTNYKRKSVEGISPLLLFCIFFAYVLWSLYAWTKPDLFLILTQTPGSALSLILLFQLFYYGRNRAPR